MARGARTGFTPQAVARIQSATCRQNGGVTPPGSFAAWVQSVTATSTGTAAPTSGAGGGGTAPSPAPAAPGTSS